MKSKKRLLDLFSGAGGCAKGYQLAGFYVVGVDIKPMPRYCGDEFVQGDAMEYLREHGAKFDAIHASPPCQGYSRSRNNGCHKDAPRLIDETRELLISSHRPYVIENVEGATMDNAPLYGAFVITICGAYFGLGCSGFDLSRHRLFETNFPIAPLPCVHRRGHTVGVYGNGTNSWHRKKFGRCITQKEKKQAMGIDWMNPRELTQAIPPAYTEFIGRKLITVC